MEKLLLSYYKSPVGTLEICADDTCILSIKFVDESVKKHRKKKNAIIEIAIRQLTEYFGKKRIVFDLPLKPDGTVFQKKVWITLLRVPYGQTSTYKEIADKIGKPGAVRAVGRANSSNPIPIIIPCHRVIGCNQHLTGYAGGIWRKEWLLKHEGVFLF
jgi:methylated-DNA-[protein]-cysteine S-methyltransferase